MSPDIIITTTTTTSHHLWKMTSFVSPRISPNNTHLHIPLPPQSCSPPTPSTFYFFHFSLLSLSSFPISPPSSLHPFTSLLLSRYIYIPHHYAHIPVLGAVDITLHHIIYNKTCMYFILSTIIHHNKNNKRVVQSRINIRSRVHFHLFLESYHCQE